MMPTMVTLQERASLRDWVALNWLGAGSIVEIGAFAGGSATAILQGMEMARHPGTLHVYDTFKFPKGGHEQVYRALVGLQGESFRPAFDAIMRQWQHRLRVVEGDASQAAWTAGPIEILHIDCSVSREFHERIALEFYPQLLTGATLVHQDYGYEKAPFIVEMMERLKPWFQRWGTVETTCYFQVKNQVSFGEIDQALYGDRAKAA